MEDQLLDARLASWLHEGPTAAADWVAESVLAHARRNPRRAPARARWGGIMRAAALPARPGLVVRPVVVVLALAVLLALAGAVYVGWRQNAIVPPLPTPSPSAGTPAPSTPTGQVVCPPGADPGVPGAPNQARPARSLKTHIGIDSESNALVYPAGSSIWTFDLCTYAWRDTGRRFSAYFGEGRAVAYDVDSDRVVIVAGGFLQSFTAVYDANSNTVKAGDPRTGPLGMPTAVYDPSTGLVIVRNGGSSRLWTYRLETDEWQELEQRGDVPPRGDAVLSYDLSVARLILYLRYDDDTTQPGQATYEFDLRSSTWHRQEIDTPALDYSWWHEARFSGTYDVLSERTLIYNNGRLIAYDATRHEWSVISDEPDIRSTEMGVSLAYDPNGERVIALGANPLGNVRPLPGSNSTMSNDVAALDFSSATWTELLAGAVSPAYDLSPAPSEPSN